MGNAEYEQKLIALLPVMDTKDILKVLGISQSTFDRHVRALRQRLEKEKAGALDKHPAHLEAEPLSANDKDSTVPVSVEGDEPLQTSKEA